MGQQDFKVKMEQPLLNKAPVENCSLPNAVELVPFSDKRCDDG